MQTTGKSPFASRWYLAASIALFLLPACLAHAPLDQARPGPEPDLLSLLPALPDDSGQPRRASEETFIIRDGIDRFEDSGGVTEDGMHLLIEAGPEDIAWAVYQFSVGFETPLYDMFVSMSVTGGAGAYIAMANYDTGLWEFSGPFDQSHSLSVRDGSYFSPGLNVYMALIAWDGVSIDCTGSSLTYESGVVLPATYADDMAEIFNDNCMPCHSADVAQNGVVLDSYWRSYESADQALLKAQNDHAPSDSAQITQEEKDRFQSWVDNNQPYGIDMTFTSHIGPLTQNRCSPCHVDGGNSGGVNFDTYESTFPVGEQMWNRVRINSMPFGGPPLPDSEKDQLFGWVEQGKPE